MGQCDKGMTFNCFKKFITTTSLPCRVWSLVHRGVNDMMEFFSCNDMSSVTWPHFASRAGARNHNRQSHALHCKT